MTKTLAERCYVSFVEALGWVEAPAFSDLADGGEAWCRVVNEKAKILTPPPVADPIEYTLSEPKIIPVHPTTGKPLADKTPDAFTLRPVQMRDLCRDEFAEGRHLYNLSVAASVLGVVNSKLDEVIDPIDVDAMSRLITHLSGADADDEVMRIANVFVEGFTLEQHRAAYRAATFTLQIDDCGKTMTVDTRGLGRVTVGPYRTKHERLWKDGRDEKDEWSARLDALAHASSFPVDTLMTARPEDVFVLWEALSRLKKKSDEAAISIFSSRRAAMSSGSASETSTTGPLAS